MINLLFFFLIEVCADGSDMSLYYFMLRPLCAAKQTKRNAVFTILPMVFIVLTLDYVFEYNKALLAFSIGNIIWVIWGSLKVEKKKRILVIFQVFLAWVIITLSDSVLVCIPLLFGHTSFAILRSATLTRFICMCLSRGIAFLIAYRFMRYYSADDVEEKSLISHYIIALFILYIISTNYMLKGAIRTEHLGNGIITINLKIMLLIQLFMLIMLHFLFNIFRRIRQANRISHENSVQRQVIQEQKNAIRTIRKKQHEYKSNIQSIHALLLDQNIEEARAFMNQLLQQSVTTDKMIWKNESFVKTMMSYKIQEAVEKQIEVSQDVTISHDIPIDDCDMAIIINNAMNNAMEACEKLPVSRRYIKCIVNMKLKYLNFYFENPYAGNLGFENGKLETTKINKPEHGIGIENIENVVNKYQGFLNYYFEEQVFYLKCSLLIPDNKIA